MSHPKQLESHLTKIYSHESAFANKEFSLILTYYHTNAEGSYPIGMHEHTFYEINIIVQGKGFHYLEQQCLEAQAGDVFILPPGFKHGYHTNDPDNFKICHILLDCTFMERYKRELQDLPGYTVLFETEPFWRTISNEKILLSLNESQLKKVSLDIEELISYETSSYKGNEIQKISKCLYLLAYFCERIYTEHEQKFKSPQLRTESIAIIHTLEYIQNKFYEKISVDDLTRIAHMSRSTYLRHFKRMCNCSPQQYLTETRITKAIDLLKNTNRSITEIAQDCGFFDSSHFSHIFYKTKGFLPSAIRKQANE